MTTTAPDVVVDVDISAPAPTVWAAVADPSRITGWSPESYAVASSTTGPLPVGARFSGSNRRGFHRWTTRCTVVESDPGHAFAFDVRYYGLSVARWEYVVTATESGSHVEERFYDHRGRLMWLLGLVGTGVRDRRTHNAETMRATLAALKSDLEQTSTRER